jgi:hypothetical protein
MEQKASVNRSKVCCDTYKSMNFKRSALSLEEKVNIDASFDVFDFEDGKSRFVAYKLPERKPFYYIAVRSYSSHVYVAAGTVFYPILLFLGSNIEIIKELSWPTVRTEGSTWTERPRLETIVTIDHSRYDAKYLIIYSDIKNIGNLVPIFVPNGPRHIPISPHGELKVVFADELENL